MKYGKTILFSLLIIAGITWWGISNDSSSPNLPPLHTETAEVGDVSQRVIAFGSLEPVQKVTVGSEVSGIIDELYVDFNSVVQRGDVLAQIESSTFKAEVSSAEAELESAESGLELAQMQYERMKDLQERQFVSMSDLDEARSNLRQAEAQVRVRQHSLERAQRELDRTTITSPTDGMVISRDVDVGQTVAASLSAPILFQIAADLRAMQIHANVSEADIGTVDEGQSVRFQVDAYRDREFEGEVIQVRNAPIVEDNVVHYQTIISVDNDERLLKPGMTAEVSIITEERHDVLRLRNNALRARLPDNIRPDDPEEIDDMNALVYYRENGQLRAKWIKTGLSDGVYTEIIEGLETGDELVVGLSLSQQQSDEGRRSLFGGSQAEY